MDLFEFENQRFNGLWDGKSIKKVQKAVPHKITLKIQEDIDDIQDESYREFQEANFDEYFTGSYKYCLWK